MVEDTKVYGRINRKTKREVAKYKIEFWDRKCQELDRFIDGTKVAAPWRRIKRIKQDTKEAGAISLIGLPEWKKYYEYLLTENREKFKELCKAICRVGRAGRPLLRWDTIQVHKDTTKAIS